MKTTGWRRVASAVWRGPNDPQIFGMFEVDATRLLAFIDAARDRGVRLTPTHLLGRATACAVHAVPDFNVRLVAGRAFPRPSVDIFFITAVEGGRDLSGVKVEATDRKSASQVAKEVSRRAAELRSGADPHFAKTKRMTERLPMPVLRWVLRLFAWIAGDLNLRLPKLGVDRSPFGSAMISNVATFGLPIGFSPLAWLYKVPLLILAGEIADRPMVVDGKVVVRPVMPITATIDHRYADGWHIGALFRPFRAYLEDPARFEPPLPSRAAKPARRRDGDAHVLSRPT